MGISSYKKLFFGLFLAIGLLVFTQTSADEALSQREVADSVQSSVVKIVQHVKGDASIPAINIDFKSGTITTKSDVDPQKIDIDEFLTGSGVIVTPDGYILTNSHVISYQTIKNIIVSDFIYQAIDEAYSTLSEQEVKDISSSQTPAQMSQFAEKIADYILSQSKFNLEKNIVVLNPASNKTNLDELYQDSFPASVVSVNDNFFKDNRDAGLIKISEQDLPSVNLGASTDVSTGKKVYIFGYPSTAEINQNDQLEPTFSQGTVSAIKSSPNRDFKVFQTDAKISKGSSGGPLLDEQGKVIGLVTFMTSDLSKQDGDSFAFAIPIDEAEKIIADNSTGGNLPAQFQIGAYNKHFASGLGYLKTNQCRNALNEFVLAKQVNDKFNVARFIEPYEKQCDDIIASGKSVDGFWSSFKYKLSDTKNLVIFLSALGVILILGLAFAWYWLFRRMRHDEQELDNVEEFLHLDPENGQPIDKDKYVINELPDHLKPKIHK